MRYLVLLWFVINPALAGMWLAQVTAKPQTPEFVWPVSLVSWLSAVLTLFLIIDRVLTAWRGGQKPIYQKIDASTIELKEEMARIRKDVERDMAQHRKEIDKDLNGLGGRITDTEREVTVALAGGAQLAERMTKSEADRVALWREFGQFRDEMRENHKDVVRTSRIARRQILAAIAQMAVGKQQ